jgi:hypothetical protein
MTFLPLLNLRFPRRESEASRIDYRLNNKLYLVRRHLSGKGKLASLRLQIAIVPN